MPKEKEKIEELVKSLHHYSLSCQNAQTDDDPNIKAYLEQANYVVNQLLELFSQERQKWLKEYEEKRNV